MRATAMMDDVERHFDRMLQVVAMLLVAVTVGCARGAASGPPASSPTTGATAETAEEDEASLGLREHHGHHHHAGLSLLIALSLDTLGVSPEQRSAVDKIRGDLHARMETARAAERALHTLLADGVAAGEIDHAKADAASAQVATAAAAVREATVDALDQLHAVLTPPQRAALIDKVEAHWEVWQKANDDTQKDSTGRPRTGGHLAWLAREVSLTDDQLERIRANLAGAEATAPRLDRQQVDARIQAVGDAFRGDVFDAKTVTTSGSADEHVAGVGAARMVRFYEAVAPVLTAEQRARVAEILREFASHDPGVTGA